MPAAKRFLGHAAAAVLAAGLASTPAKAQFAGFGGGADGGGDMMTQAAPMLEMMKAKMGKKRFAMLMQTMGPMMSRMMENGGGFGGANFGGFGGGGFASPGYGDAGYGGYGMGGGNMMAMFGGGNGSEMMAMIPQLISMADSGRGHRKHRRRR